MSEPEGIFDEDAELKKAAEEVLERAKEGDVQAQAQVFSWEHGAEAGELFLRAAEGDTDDMIRFLSQFHEDYLTPPDQVEAFLEATDKADAGDPVSIEQCLRFAGLPDVDAAMSRVLSGEPYLYLILLNSLKSRDAQARTVARRCLESHGWDQRAYAELSKEDEQ